MCSPPGAGYGQGAVTTGGTGTYLSMSTRRTESRLIKSRAEELNPLHNCSECGLEHFYIPRMQMSALNQEGEIVQSPLIPIEIVVVADGSTPFSCDSEPRHDSRVPVVGMLWSTPGSTQSYATSVIVLN